MRARLPVRLPTVSADVTSADLPDQTKSDGAGRHGGFRGATTNVKQDFRMLTFMGQGRTSTCNGVTRRDFLQAGTLGAIGFGLPQWFAAQAAGAVEPGQATARAS